MFDDFALSTKPPSHQATKPPAITEKNLIKSNLVLFLLLWIG